MVNGKSRSRITTLAAFKASGLWFGFRFSSRKHLVIIFFTLDSGFDVSMPLDVDAIDEEGESKRG